MPRKRRVTVPGMVYHVLNRRVMRLEMFKKDADYDAFQGILAASLNREDAPSLLAYCLMPNHWHLVVQAGDRTDLSTWMHWTAVTHARRWLLHHELVGQGSLYQGRFKSFPVQCDDHFLTVCQYVEANALTAGLVTHAEDWRWGSLWCQLRGGALRRCLGDWPVMAPHDWCRQVNTRLSYAKEQAIRESVNHGTPFGASDWQEREGVRSRQMLPRL